jgi:hypothetical protein
MSPFENEKRSIPFSTWATSISRHMFPDNLLEDPFVNEDVFCTRNTFLDSFQGKKILIVGGGPSTREFDFSNHNYDSIWSCNHFFLNDTLDKTKVDLISIAGELDIEDSKFLDYTQRYNPIVCLEIHHKWQGYKFNNYENYMVFHSNFYGKLGICVRQIIMAAFCGAPEIGFVGLDGPKYIKKGDHAFEKDKNLLPSGYNNEMYFNQYKIFWQYIQKKFPDTVFKNLGYKNNYHPVEIS